MLPEIKNNLRRYNSCNFENKLFCKKDRDDKDIGNDKYLTPIDFANNNIIINTDKYYKPIELSKNIKKCFYDNCNSKNIFQVYLPNSKLYGLYTCNEHYKNGLENIFIFCVHNKIYSTCDMYILPRILHYEHYDVKKEQIIILDNFTIPPNYWTKKIENDLYVPIMYNNNIKEIRLKSLCKYNFLNYKKIIRFIRYKLYKRIMNIIE